MRALSEYPNIGKGIEKQLHEAGIETYQQLCEIGAEAAWLKIQCNNKRTSLLRLLALEGAIERMRMSTLPEKRKDELREFFNAHKVSRNKK